MQRRRDSKSSDWESSRGRGVPASTRRGIHSAPREAHEAAQNIFLKARFFFLTFLGTFLLMPLSAQELHLQIVAATGTPMEVQEALWHGADINNMTVSGVTPIMAAAGSNHDHIVVSVLLKSGANIDARNKFGETALMYAAQYNSNPEMIATLLAAGADVGERDVLGRTALILAAKSNGNLEVIALLLKAGCAVDPRDMMGMAALLYAARQNPNQRIITKLLKAGADPKATSNDGKTALDYARDNPLLPSDSEAFLALEKASK